MQVRKFLGERKMKSTLVMFIIVCFIFSVSQGAISFVCDNNMPDPNEEVTVYVHTDTPLFALGACIFVVGDANITTGMCEADCNQYGWDNGWNSDPYIDPNGWIYLSGVKWNADANGTVAYFKFRYNSGQVSVYFDTEWSEAFGFDWESRETVYSTFSTNTLLFGLPDPNEGDSSMQNELMEGNDLQMDYLSSYNEILTGVHQYSTPISYSSKTILSTDDSYLVYDSNFTLTDCVMDVNGSVEFNGNVTLTNSKIRVKGNLICKSGIEITETGASCIKATGDSTQAGKIIIEGKIDNPITVISDYVSNDSEFIIIDANSSSNSSMKCIDFYGGWTNIQIYNKRLNNPISNCYFSGAKYAIWQDGLDELTDIRFSFFYENYTSIHCNMMPITSNSDTSVWIDNVLIDNQYVEESTGFELVGSDNENLYGHLKLTNSIFTNCYWSWYFYESYFTWDLTNLAYYENLDDDPAMGQYQTNAMYLTQSPFVSYGGWPYFTNPASPVADVNFGYNISEDAPEQMLTSVYSDSTPRTNIGLGFGLALPSEYVSHVPSLIKGDFDNSGMVNNHDYYVFAADWRSIHGGSHPIHYPDINGYSVADFDKGGVVNGLDLAVFASNWLSKDSIELTIDSNETLVTATCQQINGLYIKYYIFFLDGKYIGLRDPNENTVLTIDKRLYSQGTHNLKAVLVTKNGNQFYTENKQVSFSPALSYLNFDESFDPTKKFVISGKVNAGYIATVSLKNFDNQVLWSDSYSSDFMTKLNSSLFSSEIQFEVTYSYEQSTLQMLDGGSSMLMSSMSSSSSSSGSSSVMGVDGYPDSRTAGLILCMMEDGVKEGADELSTGVCRFAGEMMWNNGIWPITLRGYNGYNEVRCGMIKRVFQKYPNIRYCHIYAHGDYVTDRAWPLTGNARRTRLVFNDGEWVAFNSRKWREKHQVVPTGYEYLSNFYEHAHYLNQIPFAPGQLKILVIESCYALRNVVTIDGDGLCHYVNGQYDWEANNHVNSSYAYNYPYSDLCAGLNMTEQNQFILGGGDLVIKGPYTYYSRFFNYFWRALTEDDGNGQINTTLGAWNYAYNNSGTTLEVQYKHRWRGRGVNVTLSGN